MKALVIYYSQTGNTKEVAKNIACGLGETDVETKLVPIERSQKKDYSTNVEEAKRGVEAKIEPTETDLSEYELVCLGTPIWSSAPATPVNGYLAKCEGVEGTDILCFATHGGGGPGDTFKLMKSKLEGKGGKVLSTFALSSKEVSTKKGKRAAREAGRRLKK